MDSPVDISVGMVTRLKEWNTGEPNSFGRRNSPYHIYLFENPAVEVILYPY